MRHVKLVIQTAGAWGLYERKGKDCQSVDLFERFHAAETDARLCPSAKNPLVTSQVKHGR